MEVEEQTGNRLPDAALSSPSPSPSRIRYHESAPLLICEPLPIIRFSTIMSVKIIASIPGLKNFQDFTMMQERIDTSLTKVLFPVLLQNLLPYHHSLNPNRPTAYMNT